jgi:UPF0716 protein FxsA
MLALLLLIAWPIAEILVAIQVAHLIGVLLTALALIAGWPVGVWLLRSRGRSAWRRLGDAVATGRAPGREAADGALIIAGGALLIVPGFITDLLGALLLLAPTRSIARRGLIRNFHSRLVVAAACFSTRGSRPYDVDSTASDVGQPRLRR